MLAIQKRNDSPKFQKPVILGYFSLDSSRSYHATAVSLKYLNRSRLQDQEKFNLNQGLDTYQPRNLPLENEERIDAILKCLTENGSIRNILRQEQTPSNPTFICSRGVLTSVSRTPYAKLDDWLICATKVQNLIFLCEFNTEKQKEEIRVGRSPREKLCEFWGRKFEQYMLLDDPTKSSQDLSRVVNANDEFALVYRTKLNDHSIFYGAEIDGLNSSEPISCDKIRDLNCEDFVELKTARYSGGLFGGNEIQKINKFKLMKWYTQSYMAGIESIICGFRDDSGVLQKYETYETRNLPLYCQRFWDPQVCVSFLDDFLRFVSNSFKDEDDFSIKKFHFKLGDDHVRSEKILDSEKSVYNILPEWFLDQNNLRPEQN